MRGNRTKSKRIGRGVGSGKGGHTVGRGMKGQKSRKGRKIRPGFEGGQNPFYKRIPQIGGFKGLKERPATVNVEVFNVFENGAEITPDVLLERKVVKVIPRNGVKVLGKGKLEKTLTYSGFMFSKRALEKIENVKSAAAD